MKVYVHWHPGSDYAIVVQENQPLQRFGLLYTDGSGKNYAKYFKVNSAEEKIYNYLSKFLIPNNKSSCYVLEI